MDLLEIDELKLYFGDPYVINDKIQVLQPMIGDIIDFGEKQYFSMIHTITAIPSDLKAKLDDIGIDYEQISDFELFMMLAPTLSVEQTRIILGDIDLTRLRPYQNKSNGQPVLADKENGIVIDMLIYERIANYLRKVHGIKKKVEHAANKYTKKILIEEDRQNSAINQNKPYKSFMMPLVSSVKVRMGYTKDYIRNMGVYEFFDDVSRLQIITNADALLHGVYGGMLDTKKLDKKQLNWMRELDKN